MLNQVCLQTLPSIPDIVPGDDLAGVLGRAVQQSGVPCQTGDVWVVAQKIVSKAEDRYVHVPSVRPSTEAKQLAAYVNKDPRKVQVILDESRNIIRSTPPRAEWGEGILITEHRLGFICANAAVDESNLDRSEHLLLLPQDPDASAQRLQQQLSRQLGVSLGIVISDTFGRPWRRGLVNVAIGLAGLPALSDLTDSTDAYGRPLRVTVPALADEVAGASGLLMMKNANTPVVIFRGLDWQPDLTTSSQQILRPESEDLFR